MVHSFAIDALCCCHQQVDAGLPCHLGTQYAKCLQQSRAVSEAGRPPGTSGHTTYGWEKPAAAAACEVQQMLHSHLAMPWMQAPQATSTSMSAG